MAGLLYLTLFLCAKFSVGIPYMLPNLNKSSENTYDFDVSLRNVHDISNTPDSKSSSSTQHGNNSSTAPPRNTTAAPPIYLLILAVFLPVGTAIFVCVSRWFDFRHHGLDIFSGAILGAFTAWFSFRYYHMPILRGSGWSWGARSRGRAFWAGIGRDGYVGEEGWMAGRGLTGKRLQPSGGKDIKTGGKEDAVGQGIEDRGDREALGDRGAEPDTMDEAAEETRNHAI